MFCNNHHQLDVKRLVALAFLELNFIHHLHWEFEGEVKHEKVPPPPLRARRLQIICTEENIHCFLSSPRPVSRNSP